MDRPIAAILAIPAEIVLNLVRTPKEASTLLETTFRGQQLQDLLLFQASQKDCDVSSLQKVCTSLLSTNDQALAALVPPAMNAAAAASRTADIIHSKLKECLAALASLSSELQKHAETTAAVAAELRREPACQERAIEREFVAAIQLEAAVRAGNVARLRGQCTMSPFSEGLQTLKAEAAAKLQLLGQPFHHRRSSGGLTLPSEAHLVQNAAILQTGLQQSLRRSFDAVERVEPVVNQQRQSGQQQRLPPAVERPQPAEKLLDTKSLRGDAAPSTSTEGNGSGGDAQQGSQAENNAVTKSQPNNSQNQNREFSFPAVAASQEPQVPIENAEQGPGDRKGDKNGDGLTGEKENMDLSQSQNTGGNGSAQPSAAAPGGEAVGAAMEVENVDEEERIPDTQPLSEEKEADEEEECKAVQKSQDGQEGAEGHRQDGAPVQAPAPRPAAGPAGALRNFVSQKDSTSPGSNKPDSSGSGERNGSGSGAVAAAATPTAGANITPAGPVALRNQPEQQRFPLPPPNPTPSISLGLPSAGLNKRSYPFPPQPSSQGATPVGGSSDGNAPPKKSRFAAEFMAAAAVVLGECDEVPLKGGAGASQEDNLMPSLQGADLPEQQPPSWSEPPASASRGSGEELVGGNGDYFKTPAGVGLRGLSSQERPAPPLAEGDPHVVAETPYTGQEEEQALLQQQRRQGQAPTQVPSSVRPSTFKRCPGSTPAFQKIIHYPDGDDDSPATRVAGAAKGATPLFLSSGDLEQIPATGLTPGTCASWKGYGNIAARVRPVQQQDGGAALASPEAMPPPPQQQQQNQQQQAAESPFKASNQCDNPNT